MNNFKVKVLTVCVFHGVKAVFPEACLEQSSDMFMAIIHKAIFKPHMLARESICGPIVVLGPVDTEQILTCNNTKPNDW